MRKSVFDRPHFPFPKFAEFLTYLFKRKGTALSTVEGYRAMLSSSEVSLGVRHLSPLRSIIFGLAQEDLVLLAMVTDKRVLELQSLSFSVSFQGEDLV